jgi:hypothetical protein
VGVTRRQIDRDGCLADAPFLIENADDDPVAFLRQESARKAILFGAAAKVSQPYVSSKAAARRDQVIRMSDCPR